MPAIKHLTVPLAIFALIAAASPPEEQDPGWPREYGHDDGSTLVIHQPQVESWKEYKELAVSAAVSVKTPGAEKAVLGAVKFKMRTQTNHETRTVILDKVEIAEAVFPMLQGKEAAEAVLALRKTAPRGPLILSLDRILANMELGEAFVKEVEVVNEPPKIIVSRRPAILVFFDGEPIFRLIGGSEILVALNTATALFRHVPTGKCYILDGDGWLVAPKIEGPWAASEKLPESFKAFPDTDRWRFVRENIPGKAPTADEVPTVFVTQDPTELIATEGEPMFAEIPGANLLYVTNTESDLFLSGGDSHYYFLISGRWFKTKDLDKGPWSFASKDLPEDFSRIPEDHEAGRVLASVPGTAQADEAVLAAQIPRMAEVSRKEARVEVTYEGEPQFEAIAKTGVEYAVNTSLDVFRVKGTYYVCYKGVWFVSRTAHGPWPVCDSVPKEIYTIPASSPKYNVTYVKVYNSSPTVVYVGYTPGYTGVHIAAGMLVFGMGIAIHHHLLHYAHYHHHWQVHGHVSVHHHHTYGHGHHYDHKSGDFHRSPEARRHQSSPSPPGGPHSRWKDKGVRPNRPSVDPVRPRSPGKGQARGQVKKGRDDLYAGKDGKLY